MSQLIPSPETAFRKKYRNLAEAVVDSVMQSIQAGALKPGDKLPTESAIMAMYGVSRTVVREALSHLQAAGHVQTRHGIGTFVIEKAPAMLGVGIENILAMRDVLAILELRIGMETEAAWLAATRRSEEQLAQMRATLAAMRASAERGDSTVEADRRFHLLVAQATGNRYFEDILAQLGSAIIPRARLNTADLATTTRPPTWRGCSASTRTSSTRSPARTPSRPAPPCACTCRTAANACAWPRSRSKTRNTESASAIFRLRSVELSCTMTYN
jgi:GntR family transcriptional repressor for pyruvate dehydrogenase complex